MGIDYKKVRQDLLDMEPDQWITKFGVAIRNLEAYGFESPIKFAKTPVGQGGLGMTEEQIKYLCYYNPSYKFQADELMVKLNLRKELHGKLYGEGKSLREIANETGVSKDTVHRDVKCLSTNRYLQLKLSAGTNPQTAARKIREKFGNEYAENLMDALHSH